MDEWLKKPTTISETASWLKHRFDVTRLRAKQADVVTHLLHGARVVFVAPTGHGKSLCYQALAASPWSMGTVLVFQPLKALMHEQVRRADDAGLRAALVNSDQPLAEQERVIALAVEGKLDILFLSPERQGNQLWLNAVGKMEVKGIVIDEAHCISQWGHDFRPWYRRLVETVIAVGIRTPVLAVTATAPVTAMNDIVEQIHLGGEVPIVERLSSHRENIQLLCWNVRGLAERLAALLDIAGELENEPGIAYFLTQDEAEMAASFLKTYGIKAQAYHARLDQDIRAEVLTRWQEDRYSILCSTCALGMGLDRANVRWILHAGLPDSLLRYVQEIGRAGRDGKPARAIAIHDQEASAVYRAFINGSNPPADDFRAITIALKAGYSTRTELVRETDVPEGVVQQILDRFCEAGLCNRSHDGSRAMYQWIGEDHDGVPDGLEAAIAFKQGLLNDALAYASSRECRAITLARAMNDETLPKVCGRCDRCRPPKKPDLHHLTKQARDHLSRFCPPIEPKKRSYQAGIALSRYGLGRIGEAIKEAKYGGGVIPSDLVALAIRCLQDTSGSYANARFDMVVSIPSTTSQIVRDFASCVAVELGIRWVELIKTRPTKPQKQFRSRQLKERNLAGALALPDGVQPPTCALLIDDVIDSGVSLREAGRTLQPAAVYPLALARAKHRDDV